MRILLFGATGMIGQGVLRESLLDPRATSVLSIVRTASGQAQPKLRELVHVDFQDFSAIQAEFAAIDACLFCLGVTSAGMQEADYRRVTYGITLAAARACLAANPAMTFIYVSGAGTDSSERGRSMWARVKGQTENALLQMGFRAAYMFRPGFIQPLHGIQSRTRLYRILYKLLAPLTPLLRAIFPHAITTTDQLARAMLHVAADGYAKPILETCEIARC
jgi:uncharacterized protein YbjT (DUF2867 family)